MVTEKLEVKLEADISDLESGFNEAEKLARDTGKKLNKETLIKLEVDVANLQSDLELARDKLKVAKLELNREAEIKARLEVNELSRNLTEAKRQLNNYVNTGDTATSRLQAKFNQVTDEIRKSRDELVNLGKSTKGLDILIKKADDLQNELKQGTITQKQYEKGLLDIQNQANNIETTFGKLKGAIGGFIGLFVVDKALEFGASIIKLGADAETTQVRFKNLTGSIQEANLIIEEAKQFAKESPFGFNEVTEGEAKLMSIAGVVRQDLIPTMTALGDIASSQGKPILQAVEAFNDAITGEFERLKEFGITARQNGDRVAFTFQGQTTEVDKTKEAIGNYLKELSKLPGVAGSMEQQSKTLNGQLSATKDELNNIGTEIGTALIPSIKDLTVVFGDIVSFLFKFAKNTKFGLEVLAKSFGTLIIGLGEGIYLFWNNIITNSKVIFNNFKEFLSNFGENIGIVFGNLPGYLGIGLDKASAILETWANKAIGVINTVAEKIPGLSKIGPASFKTNFGGNITPLKGNFQSLSVNLDFSKTKESINKLGSDIQKGLDELSGNIQNPIFNEDNLGTDEVIKSVNNLEKLNKKLNDLKSKLNTAEIGSKAFKDLQKQIKDTQAEIDKAEGRAPGGGGGGGKSEKQKQLEAEQKEAARLQKLYEENVNEDVILAQQRAERLKKIEDEKNTKYKKGLDTLNEMYKESGDIYKEQIDKSKQKADELKGKIEDLQSSIKYLNDQLASLDKERATTLGERNIEILNREKEITKEIADINSEELTSESLQQKIALEQELIKLQEERALISKNATTKELDEAKRINELSPTARFLEEQDKKRKEIQTTFLLQQGLSQQEIDDEIKKQGSLDEVVKTFNEKKLQDLENQKASELAIIEKFTTDQEALDNRYKDIKAKIEEQITEKTIAEINKRQQALEELRLKAIETANALRSAGIEMQQAQANNTTNSVSVGGIVINGATNPQAVAKEVQKIIVNSKINASKGSY